MKLADSMKLVLGLIAVIAVGGWFVACRGSEPVEPAGADVTLVTFTSPAATPVPAATVYPSLTLLPVTSSPIEPGAGLPQAEPAAITKSESPSPLYCSETPLRQFGRVWAEHPQVQTNLGCPYGGEHPGQAAIQRFERGLMLWLETDTPYYDSEPVYVFLDNGRYYRFAGVGQADPANVGIIPGNFSPLGDKFSQVYWEGTGARVKEQLGYPTGPMADTLAVFEQFSYGRMFWAGELGQVLVLYDYYYYDEANNAIHVHYWQGYTEGF